MRCVFALALLVVVLGCADPGPRDRSLVAKVPTEDARPTYEGPGAGAATVVGLMPDPLAPLLPERAYLVVRADDLNTLQREVLPRLPALHRVVPALRTPTSSLAGFLRKKLGLPDSVTIDPLRPLAFVRGDEGWVAILPTRPHPDAGERLRPLDGIYCAAGEPAAVKAYRPGFRKGVHLAGNLSVTLSPEAVPPLLERAAGWARTLGVRMSTSCPPDLERIDVAVSFDDEDLRFDVRAVPRSDSPTGNLVRKLRPSVSDSVRRLPDGGGLYLESNLPYQQWEALLSALRGSPLPRPPLGSALDALGADTSATLQLDPDGAGIVRFVSHLDEPGKIDAFFDSPLPDLLLREVAGDTGKLEYSSRAFQHGDVTVRSITGHLDRDRVEELRRGGVLPASIAILLRGPVVLYFARLDDVLCGVVGMKAREEMEHLVDLARKRVPNGNAHLAQAGTLFPHRLFAVTADLAPLFDGTRDALPLWHPEGRTLREVALGHGIPVTFGVTLEGNALRLALRVRPETLARAAIAFREALAKKK